MNKHTIGSRQDGSDDVPSVPGERHEVSTLLRRLSALEEDKAELQRSNADLVEFAGVAAHELRSPLQTVSSFAELLAEHSEPSLDGEGVEYLAGIQRSVSRLSDLVDALLLYARVGTSVRRREDVDCEQVVSRACEDLAAVIATTGAGVSWGPLPTVIGDPTELALVFQNLLSNAVKFHRPSEAPIVGVAARQEEGAWRIDVTDNGVGIDPRHADRIFKVFQRFAGQEQGAGTGIGLAMCKRIIEGHGGRIWATANDKGGATISLTLPIPVCWSPF